MAMMVATPIVSARKEVPRTPAGIRIGVGTVVVGVDTRLVVDIRLVNEDAPFDIGRRWLIVVVALDDALTLNDWRRAIHRAVEISGDGGRGEQRECYRQKGSPLHVWLLFHRVCRPANALPSRWLHHKESHQHLRKAWVCVAASCAPRECCGLMKMSPPHPAQGRHQLSRSAVPATARSTAQHVVHHLSVDDGQDGAEVADA